MGGRVPRHGRDADGIADESRIDVHVEHCPLQRLQIFERERLPQLGRRDKLALHDRQLLVVFRIVDQHLQHEAVDLRLGQRVGPFGLDRVLRRHHEERIRNRVARVPDCDLPLLHHLEQSRLDLGRRAVDLVGK